MNFLATTSLENLLLLLLVVGLSALSPWLTRKYAQGKELHHLPRPAADLSPRDLARSNRLLAQVSEREPKIARPPGQLDLPPAPPATLLIGQLRARSGESAEAVALLRQSQTVRQAFIASLVFGEPKAFEIRKWGA